MRPVHLWFQLTQSMVVQVNCLEYVFKVYIIANKVIVGKIGIGHAEGYDPGRQSHIRAIADMTPGWG